VTEDKVKNTPNPVEVLSETIHITSWLILQVLFPLATLATVVFYLHKVQNLTEGYAHVLGKGVVFMFSTGLLLGVMRMIDQAEDFSRWFGYRIRLRMWRDMVLALAFIFLLFYGINVCDVISYELVQKYSGTVLLDKLKIWSRYGLISAGVAVFFSMIGVSRTIKALSKPKR